MSFRLFIYYCAVCGAWAAWLGWALGKLAAPEADVPRALVQGLYLGLLVALSLGLLGRLFRKPADELLSSSATGFIALGLCIGLFVGLTQVVLKEAWIRVESGFRPGREMILCQPETTIGRAESCDIGLFGDPEIE